MINLQLARGRFFDQLQFDRSDAVCVLGATAAKQLFPFERPDGPKRADRHQWRDIMATVIGVLEPTGCAPARKAPA